MVLLTPSWLVAGTLQALTSTRPRYSGGQARRSAATVGGGVGGGGAWDGLRVRQPMPQQSPRLAPRPRRRDA
jgi:hypothetical protein